MCRTGSAEASSPSVHGTYYHGTYYQDCLRTHSFTSRGWVRQGM